MRLLLTLALLLASSAVFAQVTNTRVTGYDWRCEDAAGTKISDHQREGLAIIACANLTAKDGKERYVRGGRYRITAPAPSPTPTPTPEPTPTPTTGSATISWVPPTRNTDGYALTNLAGYRVKYGTSATNLSQTLAIANPAATSADVTALPAGTWYFGVVAYTSGGAESDISALASKTL